jgi:3-methylfumaryl-CoA hydratase
MSETESAPVIRRQVFGLQPAVDYRGTFAPTAPEPVDGGRLPAGWEGLYFPFDAPLSALRPDGSPAADGVLPAIDLPRRLYAGEDTVFHRPLVYGAVVEQRTTLASITRKTGRSGDLVFADIERSYSTDGELAITSVWHDVFLGASVSRPPERAEEIPWDHDERLTPDARQLFRFSAITFNSHRVHYDRAWAVEAEGLDDLLAHGPLTRILMLDAVARWQPGRRVAAFGITSTAPVLVDRALRIVARDTGDGAELLALDASGGVLARGAVSWRSDADVRDEARP